MRKGLRVWGTSLCGTTPVIVNDNTVNAQFVQLIGEEVEEEEFMELFSEFDSNGDGVISLGKLSRSPLVKAYSYCKQQKK